MTTLKEIVSLLREYGAQGRFTAFKCSNPCIVELKDESGKTYVFDTRTNQITISVIETRCLV